MLGNNIKMNGSNCQQMYQLGIKLGLEKSKDNIQSGDVLLFGSDSRKSHTEIALNNIYALEAYKQMKDINFIDGFIISCYDALHTQSREYVTELLLYTILLLCYTLSETDTLLMI